jgi:hypothetical protein
MKLNGNDKNKTLDNIGVYFIEFDNTQTKKKVGFLDRIFKRSF